MADASILTAYVAFLAAVLWWSYRTYRDATLSLLDECPWSLEKEPREIDFRAREAYEALAARSATKEELFFALIQRAVSAIKSYNGIQKEMRDFERIKHLLTDSVRNRELSNLHLIVRELETIENEGNRLSPGWSVDVFRQAQQIVQRQDHEQELAKAARQRAIERRAPPPSHPSAQHQRPTWSPRNVAPVPPRDVIVPKSRAPAVQPLDRATRGAIIERQKRMFLEAMHRQQREYQANPSLPPPTRPPMPFPRDPLTGEEYYPVYKTVETPEGPRHSNVIEFMPASHFLSMHAQAAAAAAAYAEMSEYHSAHEASVAQGQAQGQGQAGGGVEQDGSSDDVYEEEEEEDLEDRDSLELVDNDGKNEHDAELEPAQGVAATLLAAQGAA